jgi:transposase
MARKYKRKGKTPWPDKDKRMAAAVRKRAEGKSLREIGRELGVSEFAVRCDLKRWQESRPNVVPLRFPTAMNRPDGGEKSQEEIAPEDSAPKLRRVQ